MTKYMNFYIITMCGVGVRIYLFIFIFISWMWSFMYVQICDIKNLYKHNVLYNEDREILMVDFWINEKINRGESH